MKLPGVTSTGNFHYQYLLRPVYKVSYTYAYFFWRRGWLNKGVEIKKKSGQKAFYHGKNCCTFKCFSTLLSRQETVHSRPVFTVLALYNMPYNFSPRWRVLQLWMTSTVEICLPLKFRAFTSGLLDIEQICAWATRIYGTRPFGHNYWVFLFFLNGFHFLLIYSQSFTFLWGMVMTIYCFEQETLTTATLYLNVAAL